MNRSIQSSAQTGLYAQSAEVRKIILDQPELFPYLMEGKSLDHKMDKVLRQLEYNKKDLNEFIKFLDKMNVR